MCRFVHHVCLEQQGEVNVEQKVRNKGLQGKKLTMIQDLQSQ